MSGAYLSQQYMVPFQPTGSSVLVVCLLVVSNFRVAALDEFGKWKASYRAQS
jgi:hypothetical protein